MKLLKFLPNRVWRVYRGGACLDKLRGVPEPADGSFPEEWIASTVAALNPQHGCPGEGISRVLLPDGSAEPFDRVLENNARSLALAKENGIDCILIDDAYEINTELL